MNEYIRTVNIELNLNFKKSQYGEQEVKLYKGYRMVFASICEHASSAYIFASTSSDQFCHASSEHFRDVFRNYNWRAASTS